MSTRNEPEISLVNALRQAALSAITSLGDQPAGRDPIEDTNPHTSRLTPYDLARLFCYSQASRDNVVTELDGIATIVKRTSGTRSNERRVARAQWVASELARLGADAEAQRFLALAADD